MLEWVLAAERSREFVFELGMGGSPLCTTPGATVFIERNVSDVLGVLQGSCLLVGHVRRGWRWTMVWGSEERAGTTMQGVIAWREGPT